ncbi:hypothetical protein [Streptomyces sp. NPDC058401]
MTDQPDSTPQPDHGGTPEGSLPLTDQVKAGPGGAIIEAAPAAGRRVSG